MIKIHDKQINQDNTIHNKLTKLNKTIKIQMDGRERFKVNTEELITVVQDQALNQKSPARKKKEENFKGFQMMTLQELD